jgi:protein SCO1
LKKALSVVIACVSVATTALAQPPSPAAIDSGAGLPASAMPPVLRDVSFEQRLNQRLPLDVQFRDESGRQVRLGDFFGQKPVILALVYYSCPMLCTQVLSGLASSLKVVTFGAGVDFSVVVVSFDPMETADQAAAKKRWMLDEYGRPNAAGGWHFLTGDETAIGSLTETVGFQYTFDQTSAQFAHPAGITVLTPDGRLARYLFGIEYSPRDLRLALVEASENRIGTAVDQILLYCYEYNPGSGTYGLIAMRLIRAGALATLFALGTLIIVMRRKEPSAAATPERS